MAKNYAAANILRRNWVVQAFGVLALAWLVWTLHIVIVIVFVAFIFTVVLHPWVDWLRQRRVPTVFAILLPLLVIAGILALLGFFVVPKLIQQAVQFTDQAPYYVHRLEHLHNLDLHINISSLHSVVTSHFSQIGSVIFGVTKKALEILVGSISILVVGLYWLATYEPTKQTVLSYFPEASRQRATDIWKRMEKKLRSWVIAQLLLSIAVGLLIWLGSLIIGLPFPGILGILAGLLEIIPTFGPIAATIPGVLLGLTISTKVAILAVVMHIIVQQLEDHLLAPQLLGRTVRLHPIIIIVSLLSATILYGILGALLAVPAALCISSVVDSFRGEPLPRIIGRSDPNLTQGKS